MHVLWFLHIPGLMDVKWYLVVLVHIFLGDSMLSVFSCAYWLSVYLLWNNVYQAVCPFFKIGLFDFFVCFIFFIHLRYKFFVRYMVFKYLFFFLCTVFHFLWYVLWSTNVWILSVFSFVAYAFDVKSKKPLPCGWQRFIPVFICL